MSTSKRRAVDDVSEQGDAVNLSGASALWHADRTRADDPCPKTSCACPGELHSSAPPAPPGIEQSCKAQKNSHAQQVGQDMEKKEMDIAHTTQTVQSHHGELCMRARSRRLTTATTLQIASFDPSVHRLCLRKCSGPSKSQWSDYSHLQAVSSRGPSASRYSMRSPTACLSISSRS